MDLTGLNACPHDPDDEKAECFAFLKARHRELEANPPVLQPPLSDNLRKIGKLIGLNAVERDLLAFVIVMNVSKALEDATDTLGHIVTPAIGRALSTILGHPQRRIAAALSRNGALARSGLLQIQRKHSGFLISRFSLMPGLLDVMLEPQGDGLAMVANYFRPGRSSTLEKRDFAHIEEDRSLLVNYLRSAQRQRKAGANILIYGPPGTGKTEFARLVAANAGCDLFEISVTDADGEPLNEDHRFSAFNLSQFILENRKNAMILFDEIEDAFPEQTLFDRKSARSKGWVNDLLENSPVPAIWISNAIDQIDNAYLRRFDYILHLDVPPRPVRERILARRLGDAPVSRDWIRAVAEHPNIAPAVVDRAVTVARMMQGRSRREDGLERRIERIIGNTMVAMGHTDLSVSAETTGLHYDTRFLNTSVDVDALVDGARNRPDIRVCLYGPPGTGKTAFGHYLSESLGRPLLVRRASDILGPYVGMTERNIARMFSQARRQGAVLLLDEADSFLRDRRSARQSWEITQVNEMLTQMENHRGIFICSTNLVDNLDAASLRRFDFKVAFGYLDGEQAWSLFRRVLKEFGRDPGRDVSRWKRELARLDTLTPGDFATAIRQFTLLPDRVDAKYLFRLLEQEVAMKREATRRGIGFMASL